MAKLRKKNTCFAPILGKVPFAGRHMEFKYDASAEERRKERRRQLAVDERAERDESAVTTVRL